MRRAIPWLGVELMVGGALILWAVGLAGIATNLLVLVAAVTSVVTVIWQRADTATQRRQMQLQSENIGRLAALAERTHALQLAQQPRPAITPLDHLRNELPGLTEFERDPMAVVERDAVLAATVAPLRTAPDVNEPFLEYWEQAYRASLLGREPQYQAEVNVYEREMGAWLEAVEDFFFAAFVRIEAPFRLANVGGGPLQDAEVVFSLSGSLAPAPEPSGIEGAPIAPERGSGIRLHLPQRPYFMSTPSSVEASDSDALIGPWPTNHNTRSTYRLAQLLHGRHVDAAHGGDGRPLLVAVAADGEYEIPWRVYAANTSEPTQGSFRLRVRTRSIEPIHLSGAEAVARVLANGG